MLLQKLTEFVDCQIGVFTTLAEWANQTVSLSFTILTQIGTLLWSFMQIHCMMCTYWLWLTVTKTPDWIECLVVLCVCVCVSDYWKGGTLWTSCCYCQHCRKSSLLTACGLSGKHAFCFTPPSPIIYFYVGLFENLCTKDMSYREKKSVYKKIIMA